MLLQTIFIFISCVVLIKYYEWFDDIPLLFLSLSPPPSHLPLPLSLSLFPDMAKMVGENTFNEIKQVKTSVELLHC